MTISEIDVSPQVAEAELSHPELISQALAILNAPHKGELSGAEIITRVSTVKDLVLGVEIPFEQRRELDQTLLRMAIREPHSSNEARAIIGEIFETIAPTSGPNFPPRDAQGRIIPRPRPKLQMPTDEDIARWDAEYEQEQTGC